MTNQVQNNRLVEAKSPIRPELIRSFKNCLAEGAFLSKAMQESSSFLFYSIPSRNEKLMEYRIRLEQHNITSFFLAMMELKLVSSVDTSIQAPESGIKEVVDSRFGKMAIRTTAGSRTVEISRCHDALIEIDRLENGYPANASTYDRDAGALLGYPDTAISEFAKLMAEKKAPGALFSFNANESGIEITPAVCRAVFVPTVRENKVVEARVLEEWRQAVNAEVGEELAFTLDLAAKMAYFVKIREAYRFLKKPYAEGPTI